MNTFNGYEKMPDNLQKLKLDDHQMRQLEKAQWAVTEKVHGANFSFRYGEGKLSFGKRKELLRWEDDFFGFQLVAEQLDISIRKLFRNLQHDIDFDQAVVYGELFGGEYPHPEVEADERVQAIQTGIYYCPTIAFCAFDIAIEQADHRFYLDYEKAIQYFESANLFYAKPLLIGSFNQALNYSIDFQSVIPKQFGLPPLAQDNLTEGIVIKPMQDLVLSTAKGKMRPILKIKNEKFSEEKKFHEARKWSFTPSQSATHEQLAFLLPDLQVYVTANRLQNVSSKIGQLKTDQPKRLQKAKSLFLEDVFESFEETNEGVLALLSKQDIAWLKARILLDIDDLIRAFFER